MNNLPGARRNSVITPLPDSIEDTLGFATPALILPAGRIPESVRLGVELNSATMVMANHRLFGRRPEEQR
jgi:hypothetical protein